MWLLPGAAGLALPTFGLTKTPRIEAQNSNTTLILDAAPLLSVLHAPTCMLCKLDTNSPRTDTPVLSINSYGVFVEESYLNPVQAGKTRRCRAGGATTVLCPQPEDTLPFCPPAAGSPPRTPLRWHRSSGPRWSRRSRSRSWTVCRAQGVGDGVWGTGMVCGARGRVCRAGAWGQASEQLQLNLLFKATSTCSSSRVA